MFFAWPTSQFGGILGCITWECLSVGLCVMRICHEDVTGNPRGEVPVTAAWDGSWGPLSLAAWQRLWLPAFSLGDSPFHFLLGVFNTLWEQFPMHMPVWAVLTCLALGHVRCLEFLCVGHWSYHCHLLQHGLWVTEPSLPHLGFLQEHPDLPWVPCRL